MDIYKQLDEPLLHDEWAQIRIHLHWKFIDDVVFKRPE